MSHRSAAHAIRSPVEAPSDFFKRDRPRDIDRYIDYFGGTPDAERPGADAACPDTDEGDAR
jgi:hypothetical protein